MSERQTHVVFGAGQIGTPLARLLKSQSHEVRMVRRSGKGPEGIAMLHGDAGDPAVAAEACKDATAVYHCMNPKYFAKVWERELPRLASSLIAAAGRAKARLVVLDNVYMFGRLASGVLNESAEPAPASKKGEIRARVDELFMGAHRRGDARVVVGRASDFYGPGGTQTYFGDAFWPKALKSGVAQTITGLDAKHTYHYTLDVAAGLSTLGQAADEQTGRWWMLPAAPAESSRAMIARFSRALGRDLRIQPMPRLVFNVASVFLPMLRELDEMSYQWHTPFIMDDARFRAAFGTVATPLDAGVPATVAWAREYYAANPNVRPAAS